MTEQPWIPTLNGAALDLVEPRADQVDFRAMAHALANANRYGGHGQMQVSVALHTLIGLDLCPEPIRPWWLLHDGHEWAVGEITTPALKALCAIADEMAGPHGGEIHAAVVAEFKRRHDVAIHAAAGLPMPSAEIRRGIAEIDARCLATEHRDFHAPSTRAWAHERAGTPPAKHRHKWTPPDRIAEQLLARFQRYLPALRAAAA